MVATDRPVLTDVTEGPGDGGRPEEGPGPGLDEPATAGPALLDCAVGRVMSGLGGPDIVVRTVEREAGLGLAALPLTAFALVLAEPTGTIVPCRAAVGLRGCGLESGELALAPRLGPVALAFGVGVALPVDRWGTERELATDEVDAELLRRRRRRPFASAGEGAAS